MNRNKLMLLLGMAIAISSMPPEGFSQTAFYKDKALTIVHGRAPGGSGDLRVRAVAPFLKKYLPGNPAIVHDFMDGGGGRKAANYIYNNARPDGLTIGNVGGGVVANAVLGESGVQYDLGKMPFIGSPYSTTHYVLLSRRQAGWNTLDKLRDAPNVRFGSQNVGHTNYSIARIVSWLVGVKNHKDVTGFSIPERDVALMQGEIDAVVSSDDLLLRNKEWIDKKLIDLHVIVAIPREEKHPQFSYLPEIDGYIKNERERKLLTMFRTFRLAGSPFIVPPGTPPDRLAMLKNALAKTFKDRDFYKEYNKVVGEDPTPLLPEANEKAVRELPRDPETVELFKKFAGPGPLPAR
jgi:tripartite-type tricarboxylate transporter receptor subunit TctC